MEKLYQSEEKIFNHTGVVLMILKYYGYCHNVFWVWSQLNQKSRKWTTDTESGINQLYLLKNFEKLNISISEAELSSLEKYLQQCMQYFTFSFMWSDGPSCDKLKSFLNLYKVTKEHNNQIKINLKSVFLKLDMCAIYDPYELINLIEELFPEFFETFESNLKHRKRGGRGWRSTRNCYSNVGISDDGSWITTTNETNTVHTLSMSDSDLEMLPSVISTTTNLKFDNLILPFAYDKENKEQLFPLINSLFENKIIVDNLYGLCLEAKNTDVENVNFKADFINTLNSFIEEKAKSDSKIALNVLQRISFSNCDGKRLIFPENLSFKMLKDRFPKLSVISETIADVVVDPYDNIIFEAEISGRFHVHSSTKILEIEGRLEIQGFSVGVKESKLLLWNLFSIKYYDYEIVSSQSWNQDLFEKEKGEETKNETIRDSIISIDARHVKNWQLVCKNIDQLRESEAFLIRLEKARVPVILYLSFAGKVETTEIVDEAKKLTFNYSNVWELITYHNGSKNREMIEHIKFCVYKHSKNFLRSLKFDFYEKSNLDEILKIASKFPNATSITITLCYPTAEAIKMDNMRLKIQKFLKENPHILSFKLEPQSTRAKANWQLIKKRYYQSVDIKTPDRTIV